MKPLYLPGLNGLRAIAASVVLAWHVDRFPFFQGLTPQGYGKSNMAHSAVTLFFVLSGYLITLLLLKEKEQFQTIDVKNFYARRALRIWPVYYLLLLLSLPLGLHLYSSTPWTAYGLYSLMLANVAYAFGYGYLFLFPLWSVGVEEQFYLVWPHVLKHSKNLLRTLFLIALCYFAVKVGLRFIENGTLYRLWGLTAFDSMAIGAGAAYLVHKGDPRLRYVYSLPVQLLGWLFLFTGIFLRPLTITGLIDSEVHALIYASLIVNVSTNPKTLISLEHPVLNYIGRISYGIYIYHLPVMALIGSVFRESFQSLESSPWSPALAVLIVYLTTIIVAALSYRFIEKPALQLKRRFARVPSTNDSARSDISAVPD